MGWTARISGSYVRRRLLSLVVVWLGISALAFVLGHLAPGDPGFGILSGRLSRPPTPAELAAFDHSLGLDLPVIVQYFRWLGGALHGDLGVSYQTGQPVSQLLLNHVPPTLILAGGSLLLTVLIAVPLGTWAAMNAHRWPDSVSRIFAVGSAALPSFWVGYLLIIALAILLPLLPAQGSDQPSSFVLPVLTLTIALVGVPLRLIRAAVLEQLGQDYVRAARALGLAERRVILRYVLRNALNPVVTYFGLIAAMLLSGVVLVETVFAWPGLGLAATNAITARDYPVLQGFVLVAGTAFVLINLAVDISYVALDPRVRIGAGSVDVAAR